MFFASNSFTKIKIPDKNKHVIFFKNKKDKNECKDSKKAIFFDRDGVLIKDVNYIKETKDVSLLNGVPELLSFTKNLGYLNIIITNQSGISRKYFAWKDYEKVTIKMIDLINLPYSINAIYANSEGPNDFNSSKSWRKPSPNMIFEASNDFNIDLSKSILIGDRLSDIQSGEKAGLKNLVHVLTGHGHEERAKLIDHYFNSNKSINLKLIDDLSSLQKEDLFK